MNKVFYTVVAALLAGTALQAAPSKKAPVKPMPPIKMNGKAFFPIGVYDLARTGIPQKERLGDVDPKLYECGVNAAFFGNLGMPEDTRYPGYSHIEKAFEKAKKDPRFSKIALIINFSDGIYGVHDKSLTGKARRKYRPLNAQELEERKKFLAGAMSYLAKQPNVIGYSVDEPENTFTNYFKLNHKGKDINRIGIALNQWLGWIKPMIDQYHPGALQMPIIAWWGTYKDVAPLYEVLIADQYPRGKGRNMPEFSAGLYEVSFDAARAVAAARNAGGGRTVLYMPPTFNNLRGNWTFATRKELRYLYFAPITRGAMGIMGWRLNRCKQPYRETVVYPTLKELSRFHDYYLGTWHDELVTSNHDTATVDYLKKFVSRDELLADVKLGKKKVVKDVVPDVSYCLRRKADGSWMLLAVNNRREALDVTLTVDKAMPKTVTEALSGKTVAVKGKKITDKFGPFDVKVYLWSDK
ncbi:MAG: hypothetical protein J6Q81_05090 [Lentisphaeria bacterium]|nr:hypothetical protein [Lentisphaeria bacterium]